VVCRARGARLPLFRRSQFHAGPALILHSYSTLFVCLLLLIPSHQTSQKHTPQHRYPHPCGVRSKRASHMDIAPYVIVIYVGLALLFSALVLWLALRFMR